MVWHEITVRVLLSLEVVEVAIDSCVDSNGKVLVLAQHDRALFVLEERDQVGVRIAQTLDGDATLGGELADAAVAVVLRYLRASTH